MFVLNTTLVTLQPLSDAFVLAAVDDGMSDQRLSLELEIFTHFKYWGMFKGVYQAEKEWGHTTDQLFHHGRVRCQLDQGDGLQL